MGNGRSFWMGEGGDGSYLPYPDVFRTCGQGDTDILISEVQITPPHICQSGFYYGSDRLCPWRENMRG